MGIKRYKNAIRKARANKAYLKYLNLPVDRDCILVEAGRGDGEAERVLALLNCLKDRSIEGKIFVAVAPKSTKKLQERISKAEGLKISFIATGSIDYRKILCTAGRIIADDAMPDYFIKKESQQLIAVCDTISERRKGKSELAAAKGLGSIQRTLLMADELLFIDGDENALKKLKDEYMIESFDGDGANIIYAGNIVRKENCIITKKILEDYPKGNPVIAFESDLKPNVISFINSLEGKADFLQLTQGGAVTFSEYVWQYLYKNYGLAASRAMKYYNREKARLFDKLNIKEIDFIDTRLYERLEIILRSNFTKVLHRIPMTFYRQLIDVFFKHPNRVEKTFSGFDRIIDYPRDYGIETWEKTYCSGVYAKFKRIRIKTDREKIHFEAKLAVVSDDPDVQLDSSFVIGAATHDKTFEYPVEIRNMKKYRKAASSDITAIDCVIAVDFPCEDTEGWYINNMPMIRIVSCGRKIKVPVLITGKSNPFIKKVYKIDATGRSLVIKEEFRYLRFVIREQVVTDRICERIKLALAFACHIITPWNKPVVLCEKQCVNYEESASILFEKLIDAGYKNIRYILNRNSVAAKTVDSRYRKYILDQFSFRHYYNLFASKSIISSEAIGHSLEKGSASSLFRNFVVDGSKNYVFLQHGVMYMVALSSEQRSFFRKGKGKGKQRVVVSSKLEEEHFLNNTNYEPDDIYKCGLIKFDRSIMNENADKILIMITWRPWEFVSGLSGMEDTPYYKMLLRMIDSVPEELKDRLIVMPHPLVVNQASFNREDKVWQYFVPGIKYDDLLKETKLLITDYSSIAYDAFYRGAGVIFDWEEKDQCMKQYGANGRLMLTEELAFGDVCYNSEELAAAIAGAYGTKQRDIHKSNYRRIVEFHDGKNSNRFIDMAKKDGIL